MITIRAAIGFAFAIALAACQQPSGGHAPAAAKSDPLAEALAAAEADVERDYEPTPAFKIKVKDVMVSMMDRMMTTCIDATSEAEMQGCFHERVLVGFDRDGTLRSQCKPQDDIGEDFKCIMFGGMGHELRSELVDKTAAPFDWAAPEESARLVFRQLVLEQLRNCMSSGSASDPYDCFMGRITTVLDLSSGDLEPCVEYKNDDTKFGSCVGEAYAFKYIQAGVARM
jgi:hypothetical protein